MRVTVHQILCFLAAGNLWHVIIEACIARHLLDTTAYFWPGYVSAPCSQIPHSLPNHLPSWSSLMKGSPLTPPLVNVLVATPASRYFAASYYIICGLIINPCSFESCSFQRDKAKMKTHHIISQFFYLSIFFPFHHRSYHLVVFFPFKFLLVLLFGAATCFELIELYYKYHGQPSVIVKHPKLLVHISTAWLQPFTMLTLC